MGYAIGDEIEINVGSFLGVLDSSDPGGARPSRLFDAQNMALPDGANGSAIVARHGFLGANAQLGTVLSRTGQNVYRHRRLDGTVDRFKFVGGRMYLWDGAGVETDITPAGIKIDETNPIFCSSFNGELLVSDERNKPFIYTPATGAVEVIEMNDNHDEWNTKGGFVIYSGFPITIVRGIGQATLTTESDILITTESGLEITTEILAGFQNTIAWGNAFDPRTGYDQLNYDHLWQLTQTSSEVLGGLFAEENALVYWRNEGIGSLTGPVNENFRGSATRDSISNTIGTDSPAAIVAVNEKLFFADMDGRIYLLIVNGGEPRPLWFPVRRKVDDNFGQAANRANVAAYARGAYHRQYNMVLFTIWDRTTVYGFDATTGQYMGTWTVGGGIHIDAMGSSQDANDRATFEILGTRSTTYQLADQGVVWKQKHPDDASQWLDQADSGSGAMTAFTRSIETHYLAHDGAKAYRLLRVIAQLLGDNAQHAVQIQYKTPTAALSAALAAQSSATTGEENSQDAISTARWSFNRNAQGGVLRLRLSATHADNVRWGVHSLLAEAKIMQARPRAR